MNNLQKYNKYKLKYLQLKKQMKGGEPTGLPKKVDCILTLQNNGSRPEESYLFLQCIWISIRDFLEYHRGINITVRELKAFVGLGPETDKIEFDYYFKINTPDSFYQKLIQLCEILKITICIISISPQKTVYPGSIIDGRLANYDRISHDPTNYNIDEVYIASFGRHFELIIQGPGYELKKSTSTSLVPTEYKPKIKISQKKEVGLLSIDEIKTPGALRIAAIEIEIITLQQELKTLNDEIKRITTELSSYADSEKELKLLNLDKKAEDTLNEYNKSNIKQLSEQLQTFKEQKNKLETQISSKHLEAQTIFEKEQKASIDTIETNKGLITSFKKEVADNEAHIKNTTKITEIIADLPNTQGNTLINKFTNLIKRYKDNVYKICNEIIKLTNENETLKSLF
jgi:hypothetical protein